jgi:dephospho-CoA kinase
MLIGLFGQKRVGKDTIADYLSEKYGYKQMAMATQLKEACTVIFGFSYEQLYGDLKEVVDERFDITPRRAMQYLGTDVFRKHIKSIIPNIGENFWVNRVEDKIKQLRSENPTINIVVSDIRCANELDMISRLGGIIIKIERPNLHLLYEPDMHESEAGILNITGYDYSVINDGSIEELHRKIDDILEELIG